MAWVGTLAVSGLPVIALVEKVGVDPAAGRWLSLGVAAGLVLVSAVWRPAHPLRGYCTVMLAVIVATFFVTPLLIGSIATTTEPPIVQALAAKAVFASVAIGMAAFLVLVLRQ